MIVDQMKFENEKKNQIEKDRELQWQQWKQQNVIFLSLFRRDAH